MTAVIVFQICDFGLAKWKSYSQTQTQALSHSHRAGTVTHMPPEMWSDINHPRTVQFDVYSFAILLWELFAEQRPFKNGIVHHVRLHLHLPVKYIPRVIEYHALRWTSMVA